MDKLSGLVPIVAFALGVHTLLKFAFFALPYPKRRAALDKSYGAEPCATRVSDPVLLGLTVAVAALLLWRGVEASSFLGGLWIGGTLIQLYFHRFHVPLAEDRAPPPVVSPIKTMSYAIQDAPWRPWREIAVFAALVGIALVMLVRS